jgi:uncharacterized protein YegP (UPF0339 family)
MAGEAHFEIYPETGVAASGAVEKTGNHRWRFQAVNGDILAASGQGFRDPTDANRSIHDFLRELYAEDDPHPPIIDVD